MFLIREIWNTIVIYIELLDISHRLLNGNNVFAIRLQINENNGTEIRGITNLPRSDIKNKVRDLIRLASISPFALGPNRLKPLLELDPVIFYKR